MPGYLPGVSTDKMVIRDQTYSGPGIEVKQNTHMIEVNLDTPEIELQEDTTEEIEDEECSQNKFPTILINKDDSHLTPAGTFMKI